MNIVRSRIPETVEDLLLRLEGIPANRIRLQPRPGTAQERDVIDVHDREGRLCELIDGVLVEKAMGFYESRIAAVLIQILGAFVDQHRLGIVIGADGMMRLAPGMVRIPDVSFVSWTRMPGRQVPRDPIPDLAPDLAIEVLSAGNSSAEMDRKVAEYFSAGVRLVWLVHPAERSLDHYTSAAGVLRVGESGTVGGEDVLPGFSFLLGDLLDRAAGAPPRT